MVTLAYMYLQLVTDYNFFQYVMVNFLMVVFISEYANSGGNSSSRGGDLSAPLPLYTTVTSIHDMEMT